MMGLSNLGLGLGRARGGLPPDLALIAKYGGALWDFSRTDLTFQESTGVTLADDATEPVALALDSGQFGGRTLAQVVAGQPELVSNGTFDTDTTGWTLIGTAATQASDAGQLLLTRGSAATRTEQIKTTVANRLYRLSVDVGAYVSASIIRLSTTSGGTDILSHTVTSTGTKVFYFLAPGTTTYIALYAPGAQGDTNRYDNVSIKEIPGYHAIQSGSTGARPTRQAGGLLRFDGSDDNLLTTRAPAAATSIALKIKSVSSGSTVAIGSNAGTDTRCFVAVETNFSAGVGAQTGATIKGTSNVNNVLFVGVLTFNGSTVKLYVNGVEEYSGAQVGTPNTTIPLAIGAYNNNGTVGAFRACDIYKAAAYTGALTPAEVLSLTNQWNNA